MELDQSPEPKTKDETRRDPPPELVKSKKKGNKKTPKKTPEFSPEKSTDMFYENGMLQTGMFITFVFLDKLLLNVGV